MVWSEGDMSLKNPVTPPGIDPGTVRLVAIYIIKVVLNCKIINIILTRVSVLNSVCFFVRLCASIIQKYLLENV